MRRNPHLKAFYTRDRSLPLCGVVTLLLVFGCFIHSKLFSTEQYSIETIEGLVTSSQTRDLDGTTKKYLEVTLESEQEVLLLIPGHVDIRLGANVIVAKAEASKESGLKYNYRFLKYLN